MEGFRRVLIEKC